MRTGPALPCGFVFGFVFSFYTDPMKVNVCRPQREDRLYSHTCGETSSSARTREAPCPPETLARFAPVSAHLSPRLFGDMDFPFPSHQHCFYENKMGKNIDLEKTENVYFQRAEASTRQDGCSNAPQKRGLNKGLRNVPVIKPWTLVVFSHLIRVVIVPEWEHPIDLRKDSKKINLFLLSK